MGAYPKSSLNRHGTPQRQLWLPTKKKSLGPGIVPSVGNKIQRTKSCVSGVDLAGLASVKCLPINGLATRAPSSIQKRNTTAISATVPAQIYRRFVSSCPLGTSLLLTEFNLLKMMSIGEFCGDPLRSFPRNISLYATKDKMSKTGGKKH